MQEHSTIVTSYTSLLSIQTRRFEDTFRSARNIMFDWENAHVDQLPNRVFMTMMHTQKLLQRVHSTLNILVHLRWSSF